MSVPSSSEKPLCGFCKGQPVGNAATWLDGKPRPPAPCPRCGETNVPEPDEEELMNETRTPRTDSPLKSEVRARFPASGVQTVHSRRHVVMFSGGIGSWMTAKRVAEKHGTKRLTLLFADTLMEDEDTYRFLKAGAENVGGRFVRLADGRDIWQVFRDHRFLGNTRIDPCSRVLKREIMRKWVDENCDPETTTVYIGIDWTEAHRAERYDRYWHPFKVECPLTKPPLLTKRQMLDTAKAEGLPPQRLYEMGFQHANCGGGCVKAGQAQFELLLRKMPERYRWWEEREQEIRDGLNKDVTILRDRRIVHGKEIVTAITLRAFRERLEGRPSLFDEDEWGGCACTVPMDDELRRVA